MEWIINHWHAVLEVIGAAVTLATLIVGLTPSTKDDSVLEKVRKFLSIFGLLNPDKSFIGKKEEEK